MIVFLAGIFVGAIAGMMLMAVMISSKRGDELRGEI